MFRFTISSLLVLAVTTVILGASSLAHAGESCQPVFDALTKVVTTQSHTYTTHTATSAHGKPRTSETIYADGKVFIQGNGKWMTGHVEPKEILEQQKENREHSKATCQFVRNEIVGSESAAVYSMHSENDGSKEDAQVWISKSTGLLLRDEQDVDVGGLAGKEHRSTRVEYGNIRPPM